MGRPSFSSRRCSTIQKWTARLRTRRDALIARCGLACDGGTRRQPSTRQGSRDYGRCPRVGGVAGLPEAQGGGVSARVLDNAAAGASRQRDKRPDSGRFRSGEVPPQSRGLQYSHSERRLGIIPGGVSSTLACKFSDFVSPPVRLSHTLHLHSRCGNDAANWFIHGAVGSGNKDIYVASSDCSPFEGAQCDPGNRLRLVCADHIGSIPVDALDNAFFFPIAVVKYIDCTERPAIALHRLMGHADRLTDRVDGLAR